MILLQMMEFIKNWKRIIPVSIITSLAAISIAIIYGMLANEKNRMRPFEGLKNEQGFVVYGEESEKLAPQASKNLQTINECELLVEENYISLLVVDRWVESWKPRLSEGNLFSLRCFLFIIYSFFDYSVNAFYKVFVSKRTAVKDEEVVV